MAELENGDGCSSSFDHPDQIDEEMIKVATWLVELSRGSFNHNIAEPSDNNSVILEENVNDINEKTVDVKEEIRNSESGFVENGAKKPNSKDLIDGFERNNGVLREDNSRKRRVIRKNVDGVDSDEIIRKKKKKKYECNVCKRTFKSHQTFGLHKLIHSEEDGEKVSEDSNSLENKPTNTLGIKRIKVINFGISEKEKDYKCSLCPRVFTSGQALGGHKRSHLSGGRIKLNLKTDQRSEIDKE